ncbi:MAG: hypothetical protein PHF74_02570 [Dehalococcoidales bacterium]|nr:hypothetical protein [Dehalococcoidales bacterium]
MTIIDDIGNLSQGDEKWNETISSIMNELVAAKRDLQKKNAELIEALEKVKTLEGLLPICSWCKNIRDDAGYWTSVEEYLSTHTDVSFTHGMCPSCLKKYYPE